ncbi:MAG: sodium:solute symporter family protein [Pseudomonadota bacterium]
MELPDLIALGAYFALLLWIGLRAARVRPGSSAHESFLAADRDTGLVATTASTAATDLGGGFSIAMGGLGFSLGISGSWLIAISGLSAIFVAFLLVPKVKPWTDRTRGLTTGDLFEARFDRRTGTLAAFVVGLAWLTFVGAQIVAGGKLLQATVGVDLGLAVAVAGIFIVGYTAVGGLKAVIHTDVLQAAVLFVGVVCIAAPLGLYRVGGWSGLAASLGSSPETASLLDWGAAGWAQIGGWLLAVFPVWFVSITSMQRIIAARDEPTARRAFLLTGVPIEWPLFAVGTCLIGMVARVLLPELDDPELATPLLLLEILPAGVAGFVLAGYVAAVMSTADSCLIGPAAVVANDLYRKRLRPRASEADVLRVARLATVVLGIGAIASAYLIPNVLDLLIYAYTFAAAGLFFPMLALLFWPRATATGAFASMLLGGGSAICWVLAGEPWGIPSAAMAWFVGLPVIAAVSLASGHRPSEQPRLFEAGD